MSMMAKIFLMLVFTGIYVLISVAAKQKTWLVILGSLGGGLLFSVGMGALSNVVLKKTRLV